MQNTSGCEPVGYLVLVKMDPVEATHGSSIIQKTEVNEESDRLSQTKCVCVDIGPIAWERETQNGKIIPRCKIGDRVVIEQYVGQYFKGTDGAFYRMVTDKNIIGRVIP